MHHTTDSESSLLRSPAASEGERGHQPEEVARARGGQVTLSGQFLPTPTTIDAKPVDVANQMNTRKSPGLHAITGLLGMPEETWEKTGLLPTPQTGDGLKGMTSTPEHRIATGHQVMLSNHAPQLTNTWGRFEPAIRRWETVLGRPAPAPTNPDGKDGNHRLSSKFTEWMMGLPDGWITDAGLTRNEELKACGNGVVPQQAELALRMLLK